MSERPNPDDGERDIAPETNAEIAAELQRRPHLLRRLAENALLVSESLRDNYFKNTTTFVKSLRRTIREVERGERSDPIIKISDVGAPQWAKMQGEVVTFIDGGIGQVEISRQVPILLRVGSYCVRVGERRLAEREQFGYYPIILGDLVGGSKERKDFPDIVRIIAELLGALACLQRTPDLSVLMFHGPLVYLMGQYAGHTPFTEADIDRFLHQYAAGDDQARNLKEDFLRQARREIYPAMSSERAADWSRRRLFEPLAWMAFLYRRLIDEARQRRPSPIILGAVERGELRQFSEKVLLERVFLSLRKEEKEDAFNKAFGRTDLNSPKALLDRFRYTDAILIAMLLNPGQYSEPWTMDKYSNLRHGKVVLPGESFSAEADFSALAPSQAWGFPEVRGCYVQVSKTTDPIRVETFAALGDEQIQAAAVRTYLYSKLLPGYGFPVGLDIADKHAKVPAWMTKAYSKLIQHHLGVSLQNGEINDAEMRRLLVGAIYVTHRDWLFRPGT